MYNAVSLQAASTRPRLVVCAAANQVTIPKGAQASKSVEEDIYIGKGKYVKDDPRKYPSRDFTGTGGWAGGEAGLQKFVDQLKREGYGAKLPRVQTPSGTQIIRADKLDGQDLIYVGKGEFVRDDSRKYANKEDAGFLAGATGGFAGGEQGVQMFIDKGNLSFAEVETIKQRQLTKDLITLGSVVGLSSAAAFWLRQQGILQFELPQVSPADVAASATATSSSAVASAAAVGSSVAPVVQDHPEVVAYLLAGAGVLAGTVAVRKGIEQISNRMVDGFKRKVVQGVYLAAVAAAAYALVIEQ